MSVMAEARPNSRLRIGESLCRAVLFAVSVGVSLEGLIVRSPSMVWSLGVDGRNGNVNDASRHGLVAEWIEVYIIKILELMITLENFRYLADDMTWYWS